MIFTSLFQPHLHHHPDPVFTVYTRPQWVRRWRAKMEHYQHHNVFVLLFLHRIFSIPLKTIKQICTLYVCSVCLSFGSLNYCFYPPYWFECLVLYFTSSSRHENLATIEVQKFKDFSFPKVSYPDLFLTNNIWWKWRKNSLQMDLPENSPPCCHLLCKLCSLLFCCKFCG